MNRELFKEPGAVFIIGMIITQLFLFVESRYQKKRKNYRDYIVYGVFVGSLSALFVHMALYWKIPSFLNKLRGGGGAMAHSGPTQTLFIPRFRS